jgi:DNA-binding transcriptional ArsR family regulator
MDNPLFEFTRNEMMEALGMAKVTLYGTLPDLEAGGVIKETRKIGKANLYRLNRDSAVVKNLESLIRSYAVTLGSVESVEEAAAGFVELGKQERL